MSLPNWGLADWAIFAVLVGAVIAGVAKLVPLLNRKTLP